jgi:hypothetical protein
MTREDVASALDRAAEALAEAAHALRGSEPDAARASVPAAEGSAPQPSAPAAPNAALGVCPVHRTAWTVKDAGISKNGKPYRAFWKCSERDEDGYCNEKPTKAWADSHPIRLTAADEVPF